MFDIDRLISIVALKERCCLKFGIFVLYLPLKYVTLDIFQSKLVGNPAACVACVAKGVSYAAACVPLLLVLPVLV